ncbi:hypothetical protein EJ07DRAFT_154620 [Lizonia empirigonia]|nr:hypothetical protein EJ07DRAFT_154620 [Lizonia empirigonia]
MTIHGHIILIEVWSPDRLTSTSQMLQEPASFTDVLNAEDAVFEEIARWKAHDREETFQAGNETTDDMLERSVGKVTWSDKPAVRALIVRVVEPDDVFGGRGIDIVKLMMPDPTQDGAISTTQVFLTDPDGTPLELDKWYVVPTYRLKLTLFHTYRYQNPSERTITLKKDFEGPDTANEAALQLAKNCRGDGESVMLVSRSEGDIDTLHQYAVGTWDWEKEGGGYGRVPCKWSLILEFERQRLYSHKNGDVSAYVEVVRSWKTDIVKRGGNLALNDLQSSDEHGNPPLGLQASGLYRFGIYQMCNTRAWQPVMTTTPSDRMQREGLEDLSTVFADNRHVQHPINAWLPQNSSIAIAGLANNISQVCLAKDRPPELERRFDRNTPPCGKPTQIDWHLTKRSVLVQDIDKFARKIRMYNNGSDPPKLTERGKFADDKSPDDIFSFSLTKPTKISNQEHALAELNVASESKVESAKTSPRPQLPTDPNECNCNAHRWRRENFPHHQPLPSRNSSPSELIDPRIAALMHNAPTWSLDPTHVPRRGQYFIPERPPYAEPTTLRGYIRRQLETTEPVPREAYIRFGVMTEEDCKTRYGPDWRLQSQKVQEEWDHAHNVKKRRRRPSEMKTDQYPENELDGYEAHLLDHEMC